MSSTRLALVLAVVGGALSSGSVTRGLAAPAGSAFSYQGRLLAGGAPAQGRFDLRFDLFRADAGGEPCALALTNAGVAVSNGLFTATLDFGADVFVGGGCWLEIGVRPAGDLSGFVTLSPRQPLTAAPYAIHTLKAEALTGTLPDTQLSANVARLDANQTFTGTIIFKDKVGIGTTNPAAGLDVMGSVRAGSFSGNGAGLSNVMATTLSARLVERLWRVPIPFVTVTNAGAAPDVNGSGSVAYAYRMGKYEVNNNQYAAFLNAVAADDPHRVYSGHMASNSHGGIERSGVSGEYTYTTKPDMGHKPVVWVDFYDALRFCNWLHNGQPTGPQDASTTEDGAYTLTPEAIAAETVVRNPQARFWLPSDDEWYKAAYHQPFTDGGEETGYWRYPTRSNDPPISEPPPGGAYSANSCCGTERRATDVGAYIACPSYYGTFDQGGNVEEWTEGIVFETNRRLRGGSWNYNVYYLQSTDLEFDTTDYEGDDGGFRVAGAALGPP